MTSSQKLDYMSRFRAAATLQIHVTEMLLGLEKEAVAQEVSTEITQKDFEEGGVFFKSTHSDLPLDHFTNARQVIASTLGGLDAAIIKAVYKVKQ